MLGRNLQGSDGVMSNILLTRSSVSKWTSCCKLVKGTASVRQLSFRRIECQKALFGGVALCFAAVQSGAFHVMSLVSKTEAASGVQCQAGVLQSRKSEAGCYTLGAA